MKNVAVSSGSNSILGRYYPFFLNNADLKDTHYLYQLYSPKVDEEFTPYVTLTKVSEKPGPKFPSGSDLDILKVCTNKDKLTEKEGMDFLTGVVRRDWGNITYTSGSGMLPMVEWSDNQTNQRLLITTLRDCLRWRNYKFTSGRYVDLLWTRDEFTVFEIEENETHFWLKPLNVLYKNTDTNLSNPIQYNVSENGFVHNKWEKPYRGGELSKHLRNLEWTSFSRKSVIRS